jgi:CDP-paratose 2-epimerase
LASEHLAQEYSAGFDVPVWINRCGVMAGAGQFGTAEQGIFSYWIHAHSSKRILRYLGFDGKGYQVRDALHPRDLARIVDFQLRSSDSGRLLNISGGLTNSMSLAQLTAWCDQRFGPNAPIADGTERPYDVPWLILDSSRALNSLAWKPQITLDQILEEIATHALANPDWLSRCGI